jgi:hypothetical protein
MAQRTSKSKARVDNSTSALDRELPGVRAASSGCEQVWSGRIGRLRTYDQPASTGNKVLAYKAPGSNSNYVGYSDDPHIIRALFLARDNGRSITGYTNPKCKIEWLDY